MHPRSTLHLVAALPLAVALLFVASHAGAQATPLPPGDPPTLPPPTPAALPSAEPQTPQPATSSESGLPAALSAERPAAVPPPYVYTPAPVPTHAPHTAFWIGAQLGMIGYGGSLFINGRNREETSGNFAGAGVSIEVDAGARLNRRYMPYLLVEYGALAHGHRFDSDTRTSSSLLGLGFRFVLGNVDKAGFLADLSLAQRTITIDRGGQQFKMQAPELFRLGLGAEIRLSSGFTISPLVHLSGGSMEQSQGAVLYAQPQGDGETGPTFQERSIGPSQRSYLVVGVGCGGHFDLFGR